MTGANRSRRVTVVGGGIGGMAAALAFARRGAEVTVHEKSDALREVGAGLQITPNGAAVLAALGLDEAATGHAIRAVAVAPMDALTGRPIARFDLSQLPGRPYRFFHRATLLGLLAEAARAAGVTIRTSSSATQATAAGAVSFADGPASPAALSIGADGLHSVLRPVLNGADAPFFTGQVAWRAIVPAADLADPVARIWMAPGRHVVTYPLPGGQLNVVAVQQRADWAAEGWDFHDEPGVVQAAFADCAAELRAVLGRIEQVRLWGLFRHPVAQSWHGGGADGALALLGDAAHPTLPFLAQGANLALEDAWVLAARTDAMPDLPAALSRYQDLRRPRVRRAIAEANANAVNYHRAGLPRSLSHLALKGLARAAPNAFIGRLNWLYAHDVTV
ncbi:MAG: FAD-binding protein [Limimaricola sp.]|uniref:FAD-dependent monooxygenase n=1 Tax=Limimaricola sp. TaxID=2211665 RepID=UPI001D780B63|nr:FAD-dependent monooxygenase [Limimaricola sp.]MBI1418328.1 FAD-binding protein [Limimaricola sp.]